MPSSITLCYSIRATASAQCLRFSERFYHIVLYYYNYVRRIDCRYMVGTFKVAREPFMQLFSVHAFVCKDQQLKQVPLAFAVMSRRRRKDYKRVLKALLAALPQQPGVRAVVSDFEAAIMVSRSGSAARSGASRLCFPLWPGRVAQCAGCWSTSGLHCG